jgi:hypothetical protein
MRKTTFWVPMLLVMALAAVVVAGCGDDGEDAVGGEPSPAPVSPAPEDPVEATRERALTSIQEIADRITPEMGDAHERIVEAGDRDNEEYEIWYDFLLPLVAQYDATYLYTVVPAGDDSVGIIVDAVEDQADADPWMTEYELEPQMEAAFAGNAAVREDEPWTDPDVRDGAPHLSAFAPILNSAGEVVALVGIDLEVTGAQ